MNDLQIAEFKDKLAKDVNDSHLPATVVAYVLQDLLAQTINVANQNIQIEKARAQEDKASKDKDHELS